MATFESFTLSGGGEGCIVKVSYDGEKAGNSPVGTIYFNETQIAVFHFRGGEYNVRELFGNKALVKYHNIANVVFYTLGAYERTALNAKHAIKEQLERLSDLCAHA